MTFEIVFREEVEADSVEDAVEWLHQHILECTTDDDVSSFQILQMKEQS